MTRRLVFLMAILWIAGFAEAKNLHWKDLPQYLDKKQVTITEGKGAIHSGRFLSASSDSIVLVDGGWIEIPRKSVLSITVHLTRLSHSERFGDHMFNFAFSRFAPWTWPVAIVVYLGGLPVCGLLDNIERLRSKEVTIKLLPDTK